MYIVPEIGVCGQQHFEIALKGHRSVHSNHSGVPKGTHFIGTLQSDGL